MSIPKHKCSALCCPDEGIHVIPNMWTENKTLSDWQNIANSLGHLEILDAKEERDVTDALCVSVYRDLNAPWTFNAEPHCTTGYLLTVREKRPE